MFCSESPELVELADRLYEQADDDELKLAELMRELPEETAVALCTSNLTNALQAYLYAFNCIPNEDIYDLLLLQPSVLILSGIKIETVEMATLVFSYDRGCRKFLIAVHDGEKLVKGFTGDDAYEKAKSWAIENYSD
ncbi:MAG TPA: hypothetical protein O0X32_00495 [Methanocorpusculum sp.]|nr:hypothetical protein [Methanocorpusculum sp.]